MGVIIGATDALTGDYYSTWGKLRTAIVGQDSGQGYDSMTLGPHNIDYLSGGGFLTDNDTPVRFDMRFDSTTWPNGFWRPRFDFYEGFDPYSSSYGWIANLFIPSPSLTNEDIAELTGETVVASGTIGTFTMTSNFFIGGQFIVAGGGFTPPYPVTQPIFSVGKLNAF